jgi:hypothetical protein
MKNIFFFKILVIVVLSAKTYGQVSSSFVVNGDIDKYYPVTFYDGGWNNNVATELKIGRSSVHTDYNWKGSLMASFRYHVTNWGNGSNFIDPFIAPSNVGLFTTFIAGWRDSSPNGSCSCIIIWLRGGSTTYYYQSNYAVNQVVYDGIQNPLPYNEINGPAHTFKTAIDEYATSSGIYQNRNTYFASNVGIGTTAPDEKLTVKGKIHTQEVRVDMAGPLVPDYVFSNDYKLKTLQEVEAYIKQNNHLSEIPSAEEIEKNGLMLAEMNMSLLKKIEEMTLYMIEQNKEINAQSKEIAALKNGFERLSKIEEKLETKQ